MTESTGGAEPHHHWCSCARSVGLKRTIGWGSDDRILRHRAAGRVLIPTGLLTALSGIWMAAFYPHPLGDGDVLEALRLLFGFAMVASILLGIRGIVRRKFSAHGDWMTRAYAIGMGAGTQAIVLIPGSIIFGSTQELSRTVLMGAAWVINLAVAEAVIRRRARRLLDRSAGTHTHSTNLTGITA